MSNHKKSGFRINPDRLPIIEAETGEKRRKVAETLLPAKHLILSKQWPGETPPLNSHPFAIVRFPGYAGTTETTLYVVPIGGGNHVYSLNSTPL